jgi:hypothetical protein
LLITIFFSSNIRLTRNIKIKVLDNIRSTYQSLSSKQLSESWMVSQVLIKLDIKIKHVWLNIKIKTS